MGIPGPSSAAPRPAVPLRSFHGAVRAALLGALALVTSCGAPDGFVRSSTPFEQVEEVPPRVSEEAAWLGAVAAVESTFKILRADMRQGIIQTAWKRVWPNARVQNREYRVRARVAFADDRRTFSVSTEAEYARTGGRWKRQGYDWHVLGSLQGDILRRMESNPQDERKRVEGDPEPRWYPGEPQAPPRWHVGGSVWFMSPEGFFESDQPSDDTKVRFQDDMDLGTSPAPDLKLGVDASEYATLSLDFSTVSLSHRTTLREAENFDGLQFPAGSPVSTSMKFRRAGFTALLSDKPRGEPGVRFLGAFDTEYSRLNLKMTGPPGTGSEQLSSVNVGAGFGLTALFESGAYLTGVLQARMGFSTIDFLPGWGCRVAAGFDLGDVKVEAGYTRITYHDLFHDREVRLVMGGPMISAILRF